MDIERKMALSNSREADELNAFVMKLLGVSYFIIIISQFIHV